MPSWLTDTSIPPASVQNVVRVVGDGFCGFRALAAQYFDEEDRYLDVKALMSETLNGEKSSSYKDVYRIFVCQRSQEIIDEITARITYGFRGESFCGSEHWFDMASMAQLAADALHTPIAVYNAREPHGPGDQLSWLHLPFSEPLDGAQPTPYILVLLDNHFWTLRLKPRQATAFLWPPKVPYYHGALKVLGNHESRKKWKYLHTQTLLPRISNRKSPITIPSSPP
ncbi:hypothetical protein BCR43DRAFT_539234 [Syncephalastrum racemosum]|uniref:OTU domain-containing protein n=1 Tax=Syncephalastrum racemosum TaxID=13706 RepID=A0A1X2GZ96_SYNRA|nr:hypothetical protein BCR43DRAFT_539234 [Syncephalastrum racemosum]